MSIVAYSQERTRFIKFMTVGAIGAVVDFGIMNLFSKMFNMPLTLGRDIFFHLCHHQQLPLEPFLDLSRLTFTSFRKTVDHVLHRQHSRACHPASYPTFP